VLASLARCLPTASCFAPRELTRTHMARPSSLPTLYGSRDNAATRRRIADETLSAIERGEIHSRLDYSFRDAVSYSIDNTIFFRPTQSLPPGPPLRLPRIPTVPAQMDFFKVRRWSARRVLLQELNANAGG